LGRVVSYIDFPFYAKERRGVSRIEKEPRVKKRSSRKGKLVLNWFILFIFYGIFLSLTQQQQLKQLKEKKLITGMVLLINLRECIGSWRESLLHCLKSMALVKKRRICQLDGSLIT